MKWINLELQSDNTWPMLSWCRRCRDTYEPMHRMMIVEPTDCDEFVVVGRRRPASRWQSINTRSMQRPTDDRRLSQSCGMSTDASVVDPTFYWSIYWSSSSSQLVHNSPDESTTRRMFPTSSPASKSMRPVVGVIRSTWAVVSLWHELT